MASPLHNPGRARFSLSGYALALIASALAACATPPPKVQTYVAPTGVPTAKLVMRGSVPAGDSYGVFVYDDAANCKGPRMAGAGNIARTPSTVPLAAGALTTVDFVMFKPNRDACMLRWSFTPVAGKSYLVAGGASGSGCSANLLDASNPDSMRRPPDAVRRNLGGNSCAPMAQALAAVKSGKDLGGQSNGAAVLNPGATADDLKGLISQ
jgi:hypothetical protein